MLNRANMREPIFHKPGNYEAFEKLLADAVGRFEPELFAFCLMPNHWHLVVRPLADGEIKGPDGATHFSHFSQDGRA